MAIYNSFVDRNKDDPSITIIDDSLLHDINDKAIDNNCSFARCIKQTTQTAFQENCSHEIIHELEKVLNYYRQDLKQESNKKLDSTGRLITHLIDLIRPSYSSNPDKTKDLDSLLSDITDLQHRRFIENKEKDEQYRSEISHLKKMMITSTEGEDYSSRNTTTKIHRINSMIDYAEWVEIEEETKKLHNLIENQRNQINDLVKLLAEHEILPYQEPTFQRITTASSYEVLVSQQQSIQDSGYDTERSERSIKEHAFRQSIRICQMCQAIFNVLSMNEQQFQDHLMAHTLK